MLFFIFIAFHNEMLKKGYLFLNDMKRSSRRWKKKRQMRWKWQRKRMKKEKRRRLSQRGQV
jgi:large subunit ribosomal protein L41e